MKNQKDFTDIINIGNNYLILKIEDIKEINIAVDKNEETKKMIKFETNKQLNQFQEYFLTKQD